MPEDISEKATRIQVLKGYRSASGETVELKADEKTGRKVPHETTEPRWLAMELVAANKARLVPEKAAK